MEKLVDMTKDEMVSEVCDRAWLVYWRSKFAAHDVSRGYQIKVNANDQGSPISISIAPPGEDFEVVYGEPKGLYCEVHDNVLTIAGLKRNIENPLEVPPEYELSFVFGSKRNWFCYLLWKLRVCSSKKTTVSHFVYDIDRDEDYDHNLFQIPIGGVTDKKEIEELNSRIEMRLLRQNHHNKGGGGPP